MKKIYMDNAATSFPKANGVADAMCKYINEIGTNISRGAYDDAFEAQRVIEETREMICDLFHFNKSSNVIFTKNITESMNIIIKGLLKPNDHVIISPMEHNAIMRPLNSLSQKNITYDKAECDKNGNLIIESIEPLIKQNTVAIIMTHASNVSGTILDLESVGKIAKKHNLFFIIDSAQTAGFKDIDINKLNADSIAFTGHKSLLGPQGTGGFIITDNLANKIPALIEGGTGSKSDSEQQPTYLPDKFESGTPNTVGLFGLNAALKYLKEKGINNIQKIEMDRTMQFIEAILEIPQIRIVGNTTRENRTAVVSLDFSPLDNAEISWKLQQSHAIATRVGMHCAPSAHKTLDTFPQGTLRFSFSSFTTEEEINLVIQAIKQIINA